MITWADVDYTETGGSFPYRDGRLVINHRQIAIWKENPTAFFNVTRYAPASGDIRYLPGSWDMPE